VALSELGPGERATVVRLAEHDGELLHWFYDEGFSPGAELEVATAADGHMDVVTGGEARSIDERQAAGLFGRRAAWLFDCGAATHQAGGERLHAIALEDGADRVRDRELDPGRPRERAENGRRGQALDDVADLGCGLLRGRAAGDQLARATVPSDAAPA